MAEKTVERKPGLLRRLFGSSRKASVTSFEVEEEERIKNKSKGRLNRIFSVDATTFREPRHVLEEELTTNWVEDNTTIKQHATKHPSLATAAAPTSVMDVTSRAAEPTTAAAAAVLDIQPQGNSAAVATGSKSGARKEGKEDGGSGGKVKEGRNENGAHVLTSKSKATSMRRQSSLGVTTTSSQGVTTTTKKSPTSATVPDCTAAATATAAAAPLNRPAASIPLETAAAAPPAAGAQPAAGTSSASTNVKPENIKKVGAAKKKAIKSASLSSGPSSPDIIEEEVVPASPPSSAPSPTSKQLTGTSPSNLRQSSTPTNPSSSSVPAVKKASTPSSSPTFPTSPKSPTTSPTCPTFPSSPPTKQPHTSTSSSPNSLLSQLPPSENQPPTTVRDPVKTAKPSGRKASLQPTSLASMTIPVPLPASSSTPASAPFASTGRNGGRKASLQISSKGPLTAVKNPKMTVGGQTGGEVSTGVGDKKRVGGGKGGGRSGAKPRPKVSRHKKKTPSGASGGVKVDTSRPLQFPATPETIYEYHRQKPFLNRNEEWLMVELNEYECLVDSIDIIKIIAKHSKFFEVEPDELWPEFFEFVEDVPSYDEIINYDVWQEFRDQRYPC